MKVNSSSITSTFLSRGRYISQAKRTYIIVLAPNIHSTIFSKGNGNKSYCVQYLYTNVGD